VYHRPDWAERGATVTESPGQKAEGLRNRTSMNEVVDVDETRGGEVGTRGRRRRTEAKVRE
jgi:hypothetical protein